jgi:hypothetical protein
VSRNAECYSKVTRFQWITCIYGRSAGRGSCGRVPAGLRKEPPQEVQNCKQTKVWKETEREGTVSIMCNFQKNQTICSPSTRCSFSVAPPTILYYYSIPSSSPQVNHPSSAIQFISSHYHLCSHKWELSLVWTAQFRYHCFISFVWDIHLHFMTGCYI